LVVSIKDKDIDAVNAAVLSNKLLQMVSGSIYGKDKNMIHILDRKLNALKDLMDGSNRIAYRY
jgi:SNF2 domain protein